MTELRSAALLALTIADPELKCQAVAALTPRLPIDAAALLSEPAGLPGRPARPVLVPAKDVPMRSPASREGRVALLHSIAHIEFNAINLALDAIWRFAGLPADYYRDWLVVAQEEAQHFALLKARLAAHGAAYGDCAAHDGLWTMARATAGDVLARMALVPRTLEARGLDASPAVKAKLLSAGDRESAAVLDLILREEIGHVAIGNRWFRHLCAERGLDALLVYPQLVAQHAAPRPRPPLNLEARRAAGFTAAELEALLETRLVTSPDSKKTPAS